MPADLLVNGTLFESKIFTGFEETVSDEKLKKKPDFNFTIRNKTC